MAESLFPAACRNIRGEIPEDVLHAAFVTSEQNRWSFIEVPLDTHITREVIANEVVKDIQIFETQRDTIPLDGLPITVVNEDYITIVIPSRARGGRDVMSVAGITVSPTLEVSTYQQGGATHQTAMKQILDSTTGVPSNTEHRVDIIAPNTIILPRGVSNMSGATLHVELAASDSLSHIRNATMLGFIELCIWKAKQLVYTRLNHAMGEQEIRNGKALGVYADTIREYRDAAQTYKELKENYRTTLVQNDPVKMREWIGIMAGRLH